MDELVYYTLQLGLGTVLKLKGVADENETLEILRDAENYLSCMDGTAILGTFTYIPYEVLTSTKDSMGIEYGLGLPETIAKNIYYNPKRYTTLSQVKQDQLLECMKKWYTEHYEEKNNYYRMLNGQPPIDYPDVYLKEEDLPSSLDGIDISMPVHKMDSGTISILEKEDIHILNKGIKYPPEETSPYNAVRYHKQRNTYRNMKNAVTVAQKAKHNLEQELEKKSENKKHEKQHPVKWWC